MSMAEFIEDRMEQILSDWEEYAGTLLPATGDMTKVQLRNLAEQILRTIVADMKTAQSEQLRHQKSLGKSGGAGSRISETHGVMQLSDWQRASL